MPLLAKNLGSGGDAPEIYKSLVPLFSTIALLMVGNGLLGTLLPLRGLLEGFSSSTLGMVMSGYYLGFFAGTYLVPFWVARLGVIRVMGILALLAAVSVLPHVLLAHPVAWFLLRVAVGFSFAGIYLSAESWLNHASTNAVRGRIMGIYVGIHLVSMTLGQSFFSQATADAPDLFVVVTLFLGLGSLPLLLFGRGEPPSLVRTGISPKFLLQTAPDGVAGVVTTGLANGSLLALGPVFAAQLGLDGSGTGLFMSVLFLAGGLGQWPVGWLSDHFPRRRVLLSVTLAASLAAWFLSRYTGHAPFPWPVFWLGLLTFQMYGLSVALANDRLSNQQRLMASSGLVLAYGGGAFLGPFLAGWVMAARGAAGLLEFVAMVHLLLGVFLAFSKEKG